MLFGLFGDALDCRVIARCVSTLHSPKGDLDDGSPCNVITNARRLLVTVPVHAHPRDHFKKRPCYCGNLLVGEVMASRDNPEE